MQPKYPSYYKPEYPLERSLTGEERKIITNTFLEKINVPVFPHLPALNDYRTVRFRDAKDIAKRCIILHQLFWRLLITSEWQASADEVINYFLKYHLWSSVSPIEKKILNTYNPQSPDKWRSENSDVIWRHENLRVLEWALGAYNRMELPLVTFEYSENVKEMPDVFSNPTDWINQATLRDNKEEILNERDLMYRIHWAVQEELKQATPNNKHYIGITIPKKFELDKFIPEVVVERHHALSWLTSQEENWDNLWDVVKIKCLYHN